MTAAFTPGDQATPDDRGWSVVLPASGHRLHLVTAGLHQGPAVLFEADLFGCAADFGWLQAALAPTARSLAWDHAGLGLSGAVEGPRDARAIVAELADLLAAIGETRPAVMVAVGQGACTAQLLARTHPERLAGLVLVDALPAAAMLDPVGLASLRLRHAAAAVSPAAARIGLMTVLSPLTSDPIGLPAEAAQERRRVMGDRRHYAGAGREQALWRTSAEQARDAGELGRELPVAVVATARPGSPLYELQVEPARRSRRGWMASAAGLSAADLLGPRRGDITLQAIAHVLRSVIES